jgi:hypothetical protein
MKQYHRNHPWRLENGLYIPHAYPKLQQLSWWDDVGFILNRRRVMVWWVHPRMKYTEAIGEMAWKEAGTPPVDGRDLFEPSEKIWKKVGRSRKKVVGYSGSPLPDAQREFYAKLEAIEIRMESEGIDLEIRPSISVKTISWCTGIDLCIPIEVRSKEEISALAMLAKRLLKGETTLGNEFPDYQYGRDEWLAEAELRNQDRQPVQDEVS